MALWARRACGAYGKPSASGDHSHRIGRKAVVICRKPRRAPSPTFQEVKLPPLDSASAGWVAEVAWPSGVTVCFGAGAEAAWIGALLETVRQACWASPRRHGSSWPCNRWIGGRVLIV